MVSSRRWGAWAIGAMLLGIGLSARPALTQEAAAPAAAPASAVDPIASAIQCLKDTISVERTSERNFRTELTQARATLASNRDKAWPLVVALLDEQSNQIRVNAAIVLAGYAAETRTPPKELAEAWTRCLRDSNDAVAYWGLTALLDAPSVSEADKTAAVGECLNVKRSRVLRMAAAEAAAARGMKDTAPLMVGLLQELLAAYMAQVDSALTYERVLSADGREMGTDAGAPGLARGPTPGTRPAPTAPAPRTPTAAAATRPPTPAATGRGTGLAAPGVTRPPRTDRNEPDAGMETGPTTRVEKVRIKPDELSQEEVELLCVKMEAMPAVEEVHLIGLWVEQLLAASPTDPGFGFKETPPWELDKCVEALVARVKKPAAAAPAEKAATAKAP